MNDNKKIRAPKLAITKPMVDAGTAILKTMMDNAEQCTDDALVAGIFFEMWSVYWEEVLKVQKNKATIHALIIPRPSKLVMPNAS